MENGDKSKECGARSSCSSWAGLPLSGGAGKGAGHKTFRVPILCNDKGTRIFPALVTHSTLPALSTRRSKPWSGVPLCMQQRALLRGES